MSKLKLNITMSVEGFVAGPDQSLEHPLGVGGERLHGWLYPLKAFRGGHGEEGGEVNASTPFAEDILGGAGATIMGRNTARGLGHSPGRSLGKTLPRTRGNGHLGCASLAGTARRDRPVIAPRRG